MNYFMTFFLLPLIFLMTFSTKLLALTPAEIFNIFEKYSSSCQDEVAGCQWKQTKKNSETTILSSDSFNNVFFQIQIPEGDYYIDDPYTFSLFSIDPTTGDRNLVWSIYDCVSEQSMYALLNLTLEKLIECIEAKIASLADGQGKALLKVLLAMIKAYMDSQAQETQSTFVANEVGDDILFGDDDSFESPLFGGSHTAAATAAATAAVSLFMTGSFLK